jgi:hypothetical protein
MKKWYSFETTLRWPNGDFRLVSVTVTAQYESMSIKLIDTNVEVVPTSQQILDLEEEIRRRIEREK